jgi:protein involved in sex pheromone biosynthesis
MSRRKLTIAASAVFTFLYACGPVSGASEAEKVAAQLEQIYQATKNSQDREIVAAASVISTLISALQSHRTLELSDFVLPFSQGEVDRLQEEIRRRRGL